MPTNPDQVYRDEAEKLLTDWEYTGPTHVLSKETDRRQDLVEAIASALAARGRVREGQNVSERTAAKIVKALFDDLNDRKGFHTDDLDNASIKQWKCKWAGIVIREAAQLPHP